VIIDQGGKVEEKCSGASYGHRISIKSKEIFYKTAIRPKMLCEPGYLAINKNMSQKRVKKK